MKDTKAEYENAIAIMQAMIATHDVERGLAGSSTEKRDFYMIRAAQWAAIATAFKPVY